LAREKNESRGERRTLADGISAMEELGLKRGSRKKRERKIPWLVLVEKREEREERLKKENQRENHKNKNKKKNRERLFKKKGQDRPNGFGLIPGSTQDQPIIFYFFFCIPLKSD